MQADFFYNNILLVTFIRHASICIQLEQLCCLICIFPSDCHEYAAVCMLSFISTVQNGIGLLIN